LHRDRAPRGVERTGEDRHHPVAEALDFLTPKAIYLLSEEAEMLSEHTVGRIVAQLPPELRGADEVREQKGYDSYSQSRSSSPKGP
jgi:hypothetical protein